MGDCNDEEVESDEGSLSPIFGFQYDEHGNPRSQWAIDPQLETSGEPSAKKDNSSSTPASGKAESIMEKAKLAVKNLGLSEVALKNRQTLMDEPIGFTTAAGKKIEISKSALAKGKGIIEVEDEGTQLAKGNKEPASGNVGFTTASGKGITISEKAMVAAKQRFMTEEEDVQIGNGVSNAQGNVGFMTASGKGVTISEKAMIAAKKRFMTEEEDVQIGNGVSNVQGNACFMTASGKGVTVSEKALRAAKKRFMSEEEDIEIEGGISNLQGNIGFMTASGKGVTISEKAMIAAKQRFMTEEEDIQIGSEVSNVPENIAKFKGNVGFTTASGKGVTISEKALIAAKKRFMTEEEDVQIGSGVSNVQGNIGFMTASGKGVTISEKALTAAKKRFMAEEEDIGIGSGVSNVKENIAKFKGNVGFTTASGKGVTISEKALIAAKKRFMAEEEDVQIGSEVSNVKEISVKFPGNVGFTTASGKGVTVSEQALLAAQNFFMTNEEEDVNQVSNEHGPIGFTTGLGKSINISEKALLQAKSLIERDDADKNSDKPKIPATISIPKTTEKAVKISQKALSVAKSLLINEGKATDLSPKKTTTSPVADSSQTSGLSPDEVSELTRSLLEDITTDVEFDWNCEETLPKSRADSLAVYVNKSGDKIPHLKAAVVRVYPVIYALKCGNKNEYLGQLGYQKRMSKDSLERDKLRDMLLPKMEDEIRTKIFGKQNEADMSESERTELNLQCQEAIQEEFKKVCTSKGLDYRASTVLRVRVVDAEYFINEDISAHNALISIWNPNEILLTSIQENKIYEFHHLRNVGGWLSDAIRFSTTNETRISPVDANEDHKAFAREHTDIETVCSETFSPLFNEFDTVGVVVDVMDVKVDEPLVQICDATKSCLKIKFWNSLNSLGYEKTIKIGNIVACTDLQWRQTSPGTCTAHAQDVSCFETKKIKEHLLTPFSEMEKVSIDIVLGSPTQRNDENDQPFRETPVSYNKPELQRDSKQEETPMATPKSRNQGKRRLLDQYEDPPDVAPLVLAPSVKRPRLSKKFVPPRRVDNKPSD